MNPVKSKNSGDMVIPIVVNDMTRKAWYYGDQARLAETAGRSPKVIYSLKGKSDAYIEIINEYYEGMYKPNAAYFLSLFIHNTRARIITYAARKQRLIEAKLKSISKIKEWVEDFVLGGICEQFPDRRK